MERQRSEDTGPFTERVQGMYQSLRGKGLRHSSLSIVKHVTVKEGDSATESV